MDESKCGGLERQQDREGGRQREEMKFIFQGQPKEKHNNPWQRWSQQECMGGGLTEVGEL